jgi:hypothetical protein
MKDAKLSDILYCIYDFESDLTTSSGREMASTQLLILIKLTGSVAALMLREEEVFSAALGMRNGSCERNGDERGVPIADI